MYFAIFCYIIKNRHLKPKYEKHIRLSIRMQKGEDIMDMNLLKYLAFIKTVEYGSFTRAAEALNYSQSGISRMIHDLESEWKVSLLERSRAGVRLTSAGLTLLPHAKSLCIEYQNLQDQVDALNGLRSGIIRIGTFSSVATHWLPKIIQRFQRDYPNIDYELLLGDYREIEAWLQEGRIDCGFLRLPAKGNFTTRILAQDKQLVVLPENHPLTKYGRVPIALLADYPFLMLEKGGEADAAAIFAAHGVQPRVHFRTIDDYSIMSMVESGLGISILPQLILQRIPYHIVIRELDVPASRDIGFILHPDGNIPIATQQFIKYLKYRETDAAEKQ